jgi:hypothetical protein
MRINTTNQNGILTIENDVASLVELTKNGKFKYSIKYKVDVARAIKNMASIVKIHVSTTSPDNRNVVGFNRLSTDQIIENLLVRQSNITEANRSFSENYIKTISSDITAGIPNDKTGELTKENTRGIFKLEKLNLVKNTVLTNANISQPVFQTPKYQPFVNEIVTATTPQEHSFNLLLQFSVDPSVVGTKTHSYTSTEKARKGVFVPLGGVAQQVLRQAPVGAIQPSYGLLNTYLTAPKNKPSDQTGLSDNDYVYVINHEFTNTLEIVEDLELNISDIGDIFYLIFVLQDKNGIEVERISTLVRHDKLFAMFTLPLIPPKINGVGNQGVNKFEIQQLDPNGIGVFIYRKVIETTSISTNNEYTQLAKIPIRVSNGTKWFTDVFPSSKPVVYRIVSYNRFDVKSHDFSSVVIKGSKFPFSTQPYLKKNLSVSLSCKIIGKAVQVEISSIPPGVSNIKIYRRDLTLHETFDESTLIGNQIYLLAPSTTESKFFVTDTSPVENRVYEYAAVLTFKQGDENWAPQTTIVDFRPILNNLVSTTISPIEVIPIANGIDLQFTISSKLQETKIDQTKKALELQGLLGFFQDDVTQNREEFQKLIAYQINRTNLTTGELVSMGTFIGTKFSDNEVGKALGVPAPQDGHVYEYTINTFFRSATTFLPTYTTSVTYDSNPAKNYSYKPSKWKHPVVLKTGTLITEATQQKNNANSQFASGDIGDISHVRIDLSARMPSIHDATIRAIGLDLVLIQWTVNGPSKKIDHFIVTKEEMGMKTVVGKTHALTDSSFQFIDKKTNSEQAVSYTITPVFFDYTHGSTIRTPQTTFGKR